MHMNRTGSITFAITIVMITLSTCSLSCMFTDDCVENAAIETHDNYDDFFRAIDAIDIGQVANIVKQGKAPKKGDRRLDTYLSKVIASSYFDQIKDKATNLTIDGLSGPTWAIEHIIKIPLSRLNLENVRNAMITQLIACGADINRIDDGRGCLHKALSMYELSSLEILLSHQPSPNVNILDFNGETPLHVAAKNGFHPAAEMLLAHGANVNATAPNGITPLHIAVQKSQRIAKTLLAHRADVNAIDSEGNTALLIVLKNISDNADRYMQQYFWSSYEEKVDLADRLITQPRADITIVNKDDKCALDYALHVSEYLCYKLLAYGAHVKQDYFDEKKISHPDCFRARLYFLPILRAAQYADEIVRGEDPILKTAQYGKHLQYCEDQAKQYADKIAKVAKGERLAGYLFSKPQKDVLVARLRKIKRTDLLQRIGLEKHSIQFEDRKPYAYFATR